MPRAGSGLSSTRSPPLLLLGLISISLIALSPIVYLATSSQTSLVPQQYQDQSDHSQEVAASWRVQSSPSNSDDDSFNYTSNYTDPSTLPLSLQQALSTTTSSHATRPSKLREMAIGLVDQVGDLVLALFGFDEGDWFEDSMSFEEGEGDLRDLGIEGTGLSSWSESSVYVERTQSLHPSRPSAFGPHLLNSPLRGDLYPISLYSNSSYGCHPSSSSPPDTPRKKEKEGWIALVQRGQCPFSDKVRIAEKLGAKAVVFGDEEEGKGGIRGGKGLLTPWSPDDTSDIGIPSIFVSRASYLSLGRTWEDEQRIVREGSEFTHSGDSGEEEEFVGLEVVLSKDEMFAWPLLDLLFLLLFLPSLLTLLTVFTQRVRLARLAKAERAPKSAVAKLVVFQWGEPGIEKSNSNSGPPTTTTIGGSGVNDADEEREIGLTNETDDQDQIEADESTSLLLTTSTAAAAAPSSPSPTLLTRLRRLLRLPSSQSISLPLSSSSTSLLPTRGPSLLYPSLTDCTICLEPFIVNESIVIELPCSHLFHRDCCVDWLVMRKGCCPICRRSVMEDSSTREGTGEGREEVRIQVGSEEEGAIGEGRVV